MINTENIEGFLLLVKYLALVTHFSDAKLRKKNL